MDGMVKSTPKPVCIPGKKMV